MRQIRDRLLGLGLVAALVCGLAYAQPPAPPAWAPTGGPAGAETPSGNPPSVIASTAAGEKPSGLPPEARMPLPDDGTANLMPTPPASTVTAQPPLRPVPVSPSDGGIQQVGYTPEQPVGATPPAADSGPKAGAVLGVEVQGPTAGTPQQPFSSTLVVKNHGRDILSQVRIELPVPAGARVLVCEPQAERAGDRLVWLVGNLEGEATRRLRVEMLPSQASELHLVPHVSYAAAVGLRTSIVRPPFALTVSGPETAAAGDRVVFAIQVGNHTTDPMRLVQIRCQLGAGLWHAQGDLIEADLPGGLAAGEQKTIHLQAETRGTGRMQVQVTAAADGRHSSSSQHWVSVNEPSLSVAVEGPRRGMMGHQLAYRLEVANPGKTAAGAVKLKQSLPQGLEFVTASSQANYDPATQTITWTLGEMAGGQRQSVTYQVKSTQVGDWAMPVTLFAEAMDEVRQTHSVHVEAAPALAVETSVDDDPLDVGRETTYEIRVFNQAATPAGELSLSVQLPETLAVVSTEGPTKERGQAGALKSQTILFVPIDQLKGRSSAVYKLRVRGVKAGGGRLMVEVSASGLAAPVHREMAARVR